MRRQSAGRLGVGTFSGVRTEPGLVLGLAGVDLVDAGAAHSLAIANAIEPIGESIVLDAEPGEEVSTDTENNGATEADPIETGVTSPSGGEITIEEGQSATTTPPGYSLAASQIQIAAPPATPTQPLVLVFTLDASQIPAGRSAADLAVFRNGAFVNECECAPGEADHDPCVTARESLGDGDARLTVLTSAASLWQLGFAEPVADAGVPTRSRRDRACSSTPQDRQGMGR